MILAETWAEFISSYGDLLGAPKATEQIDARKSLFDQFFNDNQFLFLVRAWFASNDKFPSHIDFCDLRHEIELREKRAEINGRNKLEYRPQSVPFDSKAIQDSPEFEAGRRLYHQKKRQREIDKANGLEYSTEEEVEYQRQLASHRQDAKYYSGQERQATIDFFKRFRM